MSKAKTSESKAVAVVKPGAVPAKKQDESVPAFLQGYKGRTGAEGIKSSDVTIPRLNLGQAMSKVVKSGDVEEGDLYLNIGKEVLAKKGEKLKTVILKRFVEYILWRPQEDNGGGVLARAREVVVNGEVRYQWDKPNQSFDVKVKGVVKVTWTLGKYVDDNSIKLPDGTFISPQDYGSEIPGDNDSGRAATLHYNYIVALPENEDLLAAVSLSKSKERKGKDLNALLKRQTATKGVPIWALAFDLVALDDKNQNSQEYMNLEFVNAGYVPDEKFAFYTAIADSMEGKVVVVDQTDGDEQGSKKSGAL